MEETLHASDLAGHCNEVTAWRVLRDVSGILLTDPTLPVSPYLIEICDDGSFTLAHPEESVDLGGFAAPEHGKVTPSEASAVWSLAASLFYIVMGCQVMNGKGGKAQHESSKLPYMRSALPLLSETVQQCLQFHPESRPSLQKIHDLAAQWFDFCNDEVKKGPKFQEKGSFISDTAGQTGKELDFWPEAMQQRNNE